MKNKTVFLALMANLVAGALFFLLLLLAVMPEYKSRYVNALALSSLLVTLTQMGRLLSSPLAAAFSQPRSARVGIRCAFLCLSGAFLFLYFSIDLGAPWLIFLGAISMGLGHSLSNIELRAVATTSVPVIPLKEFAVYSSIGWFFGLCLVGVLSGYFHLKTLILVAALVPALLILPLNNGGDATAASGEVAFSPLDIFKLAEEIRHNMSWILMGAFLNSLQVTLFNASIVVFIKTNLKLSNMGLSLVLAPVFLTGLILLSPKVGTKLDKMPAGSLWRTVQGLRLISTAIVLTTTSLYVALMALPFFGLLMNMGSICQLNVTRGVLRKEHQKLAHSLSEVAIVLGGLLVTMLNSTGMHTETVLALIAFMIVLWLMFPKIQREPGLHALQSD